MNSAVRISAVSFIAAGLIILAAYGLGAAMPLYPAPWSCVAFAAAGIAFWLAARPAGAVGSSAALYAAAAVILSIGLIGWSEYLLDKSFGVDTLLFPHSLSKVVQYPGRPAPSAVFNFILLGLGLFLINGKSAVAVLTRELSAVTSFTFCYLAFVADLLRARPVSIPRETMASLAALLFMAAAATLLISRPDGYLLSLFRNSGPAGIFARWLMPVPLVLPALAAFARAGGTRAGLFDAKTSGSLISFANILAAILIVWGSASQVLKLDKLRRQAEEGLRKSRDDLDERVRSRTEELVRANEQLEAEINERHNAERELQLTNSTLSNVIEASPLAICALNVDGTVRKRNAAAETMLVMKTGEFRDFIERAGRGESIAGADCTLERQGKGRLHLNVWASRMLRADNSHDGILLMAVDVSERKAFEVQLRQAQKLESLGVLAGGIAHDFNNLLTGMMGNASLLLDTLPLDHADRSLLDQVVGAAQRAGDLTRQLLAYAGKGRFVLEQVNISDLVREISTLIQSSIPKNVTLRLELAPHLAVIEADASQIQQVIMNLVINGSEAIPESGTVIVTTGLQMIDEQYIQLYVPGENLKPGAYVSLEVSDTGTGMDEETKARIFDPFFTTKFTGRGLGLAAVHGIVHGHKGTLRVYSALGQGTTFKLLFPAAEAIKEIAARHERIKQISVGSGTILVIDDESIVRQTARNALERMGYQVEVAETGEQGIALFVGASDRITAILLDLTMPGLSGQETFSRLKIVNPDVPVILSSGFNEVEVARHFTGKRLAGFLQKPYTAMQLAGTLESVLRDSKFSKTVQIAGSGNGA